MQTSLMPNPKMQFFDSNGDPLAGGKVYFYEPGTSTLKAVYTASNGTTELSNPVILDSAGRASIWLNGYYKVSLKDANDTEIWTQDNVSSQYSDANLDFQYLLQNEEDLTYISTTQFSISNDRTDDYQVGRRIKVDVTAGTRYGTITAASAGGTPTITTITILFDSGQLDSGLSDVYLGVITPANISLPIRQTIEKTANYSFAANDIGQIFHANSANAIEFTLLAANAVPSGAIMSVQNIGAGLMTLIGTVNGQANRTFLQHEGADLYSDGSDWRSHRLQMDDPVGTIKWWHKDLSGVPQTLPWGWVECSGQTISDSDSPLDGQTLPNINGDSRFIRGSNTSGNEQANQNLSHNHGILPQGGNATEMYANIAGIGGAANSTYLLTETVGSGTLAIAANGNFTPTGNVTENTIHSVINAGNMANVLTSNTSGGNESRPDAITMVAIMKIK